MPRSGNITREPGLAAYKLILRVASAKMYRVRQYQKNMHTLRIFVGIIQYVELISSTPLTTHQSILVVLLLDPTGFFHNLWEACTPSTPLFMYFLSSNFHFFLKYVHIISTYFAATAPLQLYHLFLVSLSHLIM